jgi:hypothetical protein
MAIVRPARHAAAIKVAGQALTHRHVAVNTFPTGTLIVSETAP